MISQKFSGVLPVVKNRLSTELANKFVVKSNKDKWVEPSDKDKWVEPSDKDKWVESENKEKSGKQLKYIMLNLNGYNLILLYSKLSIL